MSRFAVFVSCLLLVCFGAARARAENFVTVRVWAQPDYAAAKAANKRPKRETYVVAKGEYFPGGTRDPSIDKTAFESVARWLAPSLAEQNYYPAKSVSGADQLLVIHWGTTIPYVTDYTNQSIYAPVAYDSHPGQFAGTANADGTTMTDMQSSLQGIYSADQTTLLQQTQYVDAAAQQLTSRSIAGLLGYTSELRNLSEKIYLTEEGKTLQANMDEERYFIIVVAFDMKQLLQFHHRRMLWSAHLSMRAPGTNFVAAVPHMGEAASTLYGKSNDNVQTIYVEPGFQRADVHIGPIDVLGTEPAPRSK